MALKNVVIGYAKGDKGDKGDTGERGATGQTGPQGESGNIADAAITDTQGLDVAKGAKTAAQKLFDAIADRIVNKLVTNDTLTTKLADYLLKSAMSSTNINSTTNVPTSALVYSLLQDVNNNLSNTNSRLDTSLSSSVLDYALTLPEGMHTVRFPGDGYTGTDLPNSSYMYSSATISVRSTGKIATVLLFGISKNCPLAVNSCENGKWKGWDQYVTKNDLTTVSELLSQPPSEYCTFSQWAAIAERSGNEVTLSFNVGGKIKEISTIFLLKTLPEKYRPKSNKHISYRTQEGYDMAIFIMTDGQIQLFTGGKAVSGYFLRQVITYPAA